MACQYCEKVTQSQQGGNLKILLKLTKVTKYHY